MMNITKNDKERLLEYHRIAVESKAIIEGIQKTLGVFTTTEALQKIATLEAVAEAAREFIDDSGNDEDREYKLVMNLSSALHYLGKVKK